MTGKSTLAAKEDILILPGLEVLRNTDTVIAFKFATIISGFPSPSTSPMATDTVTSPVTKSTLAANEEAFILPEVEVLRSTDTFSEYR